MLSGNKELSDKMMECLAERFEVELLDTSKAYECIDYWGLDVERLQIISATDALLTKDAVAVVLGRDFMLSLEEYKVFVTSDNSFLFLPTEKFVGKVMINKSIDN